MPSILWVIFVVILMILKLPYGRLLRSTHIVDFRIFCLEFHIFWPKLICASQQTWARCMVSISEFWSLILIYVQTKMNPKLMFVSKQISMIQSNYLVICICYNFSLSNLQCLSYLRCFAYLILSISTILYDFQPCATARLQRSPTTCILLSPDSG